ncbi:MAG: PQQ-dependent sugar dehydrogenase [Bacteroidota bacterium]
MKCFCIVFSLLLISSTGHAQLVNAFPSLTFTDPMLVTHAGDGTNRVFVLQQNGLIRVLPNDSAATSASTFLNIANKLSSPGGEEGLLGLAFHPNYENNGYFYVNYTAPSPLRTVISRFSVMPGNPNKADSLTELKILEVGQPFSNHNAGMILFGNDGYLYITMGDGGSGGDPGNRAQNLDTLLGKILRINVDSTAPGLNYSIPADNPLVGFPGRDEIFAWGMRNPWRISLDPPTGDIWMGDVGQGSWEEIDLLERGKNYGWRCYEGDATYNTSGCGSISLYTFPKKVYSSQSPNPECSVTGGYIYRGYRRPDLVGRYIYGDYCSGKIWKFLYSGGVVSEDVLLVDAPFSISSFGTDELGELYICNYSSNTIHRFAGPSTVSTTLTSPANGATGVTEPVDLLWRTAVSATQYWLEVDDAVAFTSPLLQDTTLTDTTYSLTGLSAGTQYYWRVKVKNVAGWGSFSSVRNFTTLVAPPIAPSLISPENDVAGQPTTLVLSWAASSGAATYHAQISNDSTFVVMHLDDSTLIPTSVGTFGLAESTWYYWRVRAKNAGGPSNWSDMWKFKTLLTATNSYPVVGGWNMLSVPLTVADARPSVLLSTASSYAYGFVPNIGYVLRDTLSYGDGYWVKFDSTKNISMTGVVREQDTIDVEAGWNLIGTITAAVDTADVVQSPSGILESSFYQYDGTYTAADSLRPFMAYWVKSSGPGQIIISSGTVFHPASKTQPGVGLTREVTR